MPERRTKIFFLLTVFAAAALSAGFYTLGAFNSAEEKITDRLFLKRAPRADIVIVAIDDASISKNGGWPLPRSVFADLIGRLQSARVIAVDVNFSEPSRLGAADDAALAKAIKNSQPTLVFPVERLRGKTTLAPLPIFVSESGKSKTGFINTTAGTDGVLRFTSTEDGGVPSFAFAATGLRNDLYPKSFRVAYAGPAKTFLTLSAGDVLEGKVPERIFNNAIVFIGATALNLHDTVATPFGEMPGVEFHANAAATALEHSFFSDTSATLSLLILLFVSVAVGAIVYFVRRLLFLFAALAGFFALVIVSIFIAFGSRLILPSIYMVLAFFLTLAAATIFQYATESREKRFIRATFKFYLAPSILDELLQNPEKLRLGGERKTVTVLFSDIRGFTTISEKLSPEALTHTINEYLSVMTDIIMERRGLVDKYIGDAIMAFWGAPLLNASHAVDACYAVMSMTAKLKDLNRHFEATGRLPIAFGVGLNTGDVVVGNMGSSQRFNYTIMGDEVNFGSRLEGLTKAYGVVCLVSESTKRGAKDIADLHFRELDLVMVKGKTEPKRIFELITEPITVERKEAFEHFARGRAAYARGAWEDAAFSFNRAIQINADAPSKALLERTLYLKAHPPENWNGVYEFKTK